MKGFIKDFSKYRKGDKFIYTGEGHKRYLNGDTVVFDRVTSQTGLAMWCSEGHAFSIKYVKPLEILATTPTEDVIPLIPTVTRESTDWLDTTPPKQTPCKFEVGNRFMFLGVEHVVLMVHSNSDRTSLYRLKDGSTCRLTLKLSTLKKFLKKGTVSCS